MAKFLFTTLPSNDLGLLARSLPIARELRDRSHRIVFCSPAKAPNRMIAEAGFENVIPDQPLYHFISGDVGIGGLVRFVRSKHPGRNLRILVSLMRHMSRFGTADIWDMDHFVSLFGMWNEEFIRANVNAFLEIIGASGPDAIVDFWNPFACIAARASRKPLITIIQSDMHPLSRGFIWWKDPPAEVCLSPVPPTNRILAEHGLPPIRKMGELLLGDMTLVVGLPELDPLPPSAQLTYLGPVLWQKEEAKLPGWLEDLDRRRPVIWLYPGNLRYARGFRTFGDSAVVLQACIEALKNEAVQVVLTTGYHSLPHQFVPLPPNFRHEPYVPGIAMARKSDLLIHHGGYGSCQTGLYAGTPALIIPTYSERESNARRIAAQGAGDYVLPISDITGKDKRVSPDDVRAKVFKILSDKTYAENARRIAERMQAYGGASEAARLIENFGSPPRPRI